MVTMQTSAKTTEEIPTKPPPKRVVVVANKWWECDPLIGVLLHDEARPVNELGWPTTLRHPRQRPNFNRKEPPPEYAEPRAVFSVRDNSVDVEVWCVSDLIEHCPKDRQSSSEAKAAVLKKIRDWISRPLP